MESDEQVEDAGVDYTLMYARACLSFREQESFPQMLEAAVARVKTKTVVQLVLEAEEGNTGAMIEMAIRSTTGFGARKDKNIAHAYLDKLLSREPEEVPLSDRARGFSAMAYLHYMECTARGPGILNIDAVLRAAMFANEAAALGFVPPLVFRVASVIEQTGFRDPSKIPPGRTENPFPTAFEHLWRVWDKRMAEVKRRRQAQEEKVLDNPNFYICARKGCGIEAVHKSGLRKCAGKCPTKGKPSYCSKACQRQDWPRHKPFCQPNGPVDDVITSLRERADQPPTEPELGAFDIDAAPNELDFVQRTPEEIASGRYERTVHVPGPDGTPMRLGSSTMSPEVMREVQQHISKRIQEEGFPLFRA